MGSYQMRISQNIRLVGPSTTFLGSFNTSHDFFKLVSQASCVLRLENGILDIAIQLTYLTREDLIHSSDSIIM